MIMEAIALKVNREDHEERKRAERKEEMRKKRDELQQQYG